MLSSLHDIDEVKWVEGNVLEIAYWLDVDVRVFVRYSLEALQEVLKRSTHALDNVVAEGHVVALAFVKALIIKCLLFLAVVMPLGDPIRDGPYHVSLTAVFHPAVQPNLNVCDLRPVGGIGGKERAIRCVVVDFELGQARGAVALYAVDKTTYALVYFPFVPGAAAEN
jgi:hypothetical protein